MMKDHSIFRIAKVIETQIITIYVVSFGFLNILSYINAFAFEAV